MLTAAATISITASAVVDPVFPLRVVELGASELILGSIVATASLALLVMRLPIGLICTRITFKQAASISLLGQFAAIIAYAVAPDYSWFAPARAVAALSSAFLGITTMATITSMVRQEEIGRAVATYLTSFGVSATFGPLLTSLLLTDLKYDQIMMFATALPLLALGIIYVLPSVDKYNEAGNDRKQGESLHEWVGRALGELGEMARQRQVAITGALHFLFGMTATLLATFFTVYAVDHLMIPAYAVTLILSARGAANTLSRIPASYMMDRMSTRSILFIAFSALSVSYFAISASAEAMLLALANVVLGLAWGIRAVVEWTVAESSVPPKTRPMASAFMSFLWDVAGSIGGIVGGLIATVHSISSVFLASSILVALGAAGAAAFGVERRKAVGDLSQYARPA